MELSECVPDKYVYEMEAGTNHWDEKIMYWSDSFPRDLPIEDLKTKIIYSLNNPPSHATNMANKSNVGSQYSQANLSGAAIACIFTRKVGNNAYVTDPAIVAENKRLRAEIERLKVLYKSIPIDTTYYVPPVSTLCRTDEIALAFGMFIGFIVNNEHMIPSVLVEAKGSNTFYKFKNSNKILSAIHDVFIKFEYSYMTKKQYVILNELLRILGLNQIVWYSKGTCYCSKYGDSAINVYFNRTETTDEIEGPLVNLSSNQPLIRFLYEQLIVGKKKEEFTIRHFVDKFSPEQAEKCLEGLAIASTGFDDRIDGITSPILLDDIHALCEKAKYTTTCKDYFGKLWSIKIARRALPVIDTNAPEVP